MINFKLIYSYVLFALIASQSLSQTIESKDCFRCHSMATLGIKDSVTGSVKSFAVLPELYHSSNHGDLKCVECHSEKFSSFPHPAELKEENLFCTDCHKDDPELTKFNFQSISEQFYQSVHYKELGDKFSCFSCHDPHSFSVVARISEDVKKTVLNDNAICLDCHNSTDKIFDLSGKALPSLAGSHNWLPHQNLHWGSVRCIDCHASDDAPGVAHLIQPKEDAVRNCVECHSKESRLAHSLYKFQAKEERDEKGFINAVILNDAYVIGATRNYYLNIISFIIFGMTIAALSIHAFLRWRANGRDQNEGK